MPGSELREDGWPARDFDVDARGYLLSETRQRVQEQLDEIATQDVKIAALFTASAALFAVSGLTGEVRLEWSAAAILTFATFFTSLIAWLLLGIAYWTRSVGLGVDPRVFRRHYQQASEQELRDAALELAVEDFGLNQNTIESKARWLKRSFIAVAIQLLFAFSAVVASSIDGSVDMELTDNPAVYEKQSGTASSGRSR
ncbi:MAG: hypothetical protein OXH38_07485 [Chloroflexi bacterium]|nr:hypothetical protein [Chloroflexota bacterium]